MIDGKRIIKGRKQITIRGASAFRALIMVAERREDWHGSFIRNIGKGVKIFQPPAVSHVSIRHDKERIKLVGRLDHRFKMMKHAVHIPDKQKIELFGREGMELLQKGEYTGGRYAYLDTTKAINTVVELLEND